jgi:predicted acylesterase/phospholipase RssA
MSDTPETAFVLSGGASLGAVQSGMRRLLVEVEMLRDRAELIVLPPPCPLTIAPIDFSHADELIRRGYEDARDYLDAVEPTNAPAPTMAMHAHRRALAMTR